MTAPTPGPWGVVDDHPQGACVYVRVGRPASGCSGDEIATIYGAPDELPATVPARRSRGARWPHRPQRLANARLIAAAPDLLALAYRYARECGECAGARITIEDDPCEDCADIWAVIDAAVQERPL